MLGHCNVRGPGGHADRLKRAVASVCQEAGAHVVRNTRLADMNLDARSRTSAGSRCGQRAAALAWGAVGGRRRPCVARYWLWRYATRTPSRAGQSTPLHTASAARLTPSSPTSCVCWRGTALDPRPPCYGRRRGQLGCSGGPGCSLSEGSRAWRGLRKKLHELPVLVLAAAGQRASLAACCEKQDTQHAARQISSF